MVRAGRIGGAELGQGTLSNISPNAVRRVFAILSGTSGSGGTSIAFTQGQTLMSAVKGAWAIIYEDTSALMTGSVSWHLATITNGTIYVNPGLGVNRKVRALVLIIGTPDTLRLP